MYMCVTVYAHTYGMSIILLLLTEHLYRAVSLNKIPNALHYVYMSVIRRRCWVTFIATSCRKAYIYNVHTVTNTVLICSSRPN